MLTGFAMPGGAAQSGWTSYPPLADLATSGQSTWLFAMILIITSSLLGSINFIVTIIQLRAKGMDFLRLPFFVHAQLVTAFLALARISAARSRQRLAVDGSPRRHQLFPPHRPGDIR